MSPTPGSASDNITSFPFQELPSELRITVYEHILAEGHASLNSYKGIYMSCRQVKEEMDAEREMYLDRVITNLQKGNHGFVITSSSTPSSSPQKRSLTLGLSIASGTPQLTPKSSLYLSGRQINPGFQPPDRLTPLTVPDEIRDIFKLPLETLSIHIRSPYLVDLVNEVMQPFGSISENPSLWEHTARFSTDFHMHQCVWVFEQMRACTTNTAIKSVCLTVDGNIWYRRAIMRLAAENTGYLARYGWPFNHMPIANPELHHASGTFTMGVWAVDVCARVDGTVFRGEDGMQGTTITFTRIESK